LLESNFICRVYNDCNSILDQDQTCSVFLRHGTGTLLHSTESSCARSRIFFGVRFVDRCENSPMYHVKYQKLLVGKTCRVCEISDLTKKRSFRFKDQYT